MSEKNEENTIDGVIEEFTNQPAVITGNLRVFLLGLLLFTLVCCVVVFLVPKVEGMLIANPVYEKGVLFFVYCLGLFAIAGLLCIFLKSIRLHVLVALSVYLILFLDFGVLVKIYEGIDFSTHKNAAAIATQCIITKHKVEGPASNDAMYFSDGNYQGSTFYMNLKFIDDDYEYEFSETDKMLLFFNLVNDGDTATADVIKGSLGIKYISDLQTDI